jgi:hypothetical protein
VIGRCSTASGHTTTASGQCAASGSESSYNSSFLISFSYPPPAPRPYSPPPCPSSLSRRRAAVLVTMPHLLRAVPRSRHLAPRSHHRAAPSPRASHAPSPPSHQAAAVALLLGPLPCQAERRPDSHVPPPSPATVLNLCSPVPLTLGFVSFFSRHRDCLLKCPNPSPSFAGFHFGRSSSRCLRVTSSP